MQVLNLIDMVLISLAGGNVSMRMPTGEILVTPSGMIYEDMEPDDVLVMDIDGDIIEGTNKPSSDTPGILYIFKHRPDVMATIHTHQPICYSYFSYSERIQS